MNILILGGKQASGAGLPDGKSYVAQFVRRLRATRPVRVDHRSVSLVEAGRVVRRLPLADYDLILLQFDLSVSWLPNTPIRRLAMRAKLWLAGHHLSQLRLLRGQLADVLVQVRVVNRQVVLLSPLPQGRRLEQQFAELAEVIYAHESTQWQVPLFPVSQNLSGGDELFQPESADTLSAVAHELLASELHTFVTKPTYTLWS